MFKRNIGAITVLIIVLVVLVIGINDRWLRTQEFQGQWSQFDSQDYYQTNTFPDGLRLEYPASWSVSTHQKGIPQLPDSRIRFTKPNYILSPNTTLSIYWQRVGQGFTLDDVRNWFYEDIVPIGISRTELEQKRDYSFRRETAITVGRDNYPALSQIFVEFSGEKPRRQVVLLVVEDEAFCLSFHTDDYNEETRQIFERMLGTLEIYD